jgi:hypothetical protein
MEKKNKSLLFGKYGIRGCVWFMLLCFVLPVSAGSSGFGLRAGLNFSSLPSREEVQLDNGSRIYALSDSYTGFHLGVMGNLVLPGFFIQPELLYVNTGRQMKIEFPDLPEFFDMEHEYYTEELHHLALPVIIGIKIGPLKLGVGPVFSLLLDNTNNAKAIDHLVHEYKNATVGYQALAGIQLGSLILDLKYENNLTNYGQGITIGGNEFAFDPRPQQFIVSLGLLF